MDIRSTVVSMRVAAPVGRRASLVNHGTISSVRCGKAIMTSCGNWRAVDAAAMSIFLTAAPRALGGVVEGKRPSLTQTTGRGKITTASITDSQRTSFLERDCKAKKHAIWHLGNLDQPCPCIGPHTVIHMDVPASGDM